MSQLPKDSYDAAQSLCPGTGGWFVYAKHNLPAIARRQDN